MKIIKINKNESTFGPIDKDVRPSEQAWNDDFPTSIVVETGQPLSSNNIFDEWWADTNKNVDL